MKLIKALSLAVVVATTGVGVAHADDDYLERAAYQDPAVSQNLAKARAIINQKGYQIIDELEIDEKRGKLYVETEAIKNGRKYDIRLDYPSLKNFRATLDR